jgi:HupE/UreJ protein
VFIRVHPWLESLSPRLLKKPRGAALSLLLVATAPAILPSAALAHDIPAEVTVQSFLKPDGDRLHLIVRVPLQALRDITFPERPPGYLDLPRTEALMPDAATLWLSDFIDLYEGDTRLRKPQSVHTRLSLPSDRSFVSYDGAVAHILGPALSPDTNVVWNQTMLDVLFEYPIQSERSAFSIHPRLARLGLRVVSVLRFLPPGGAVRAFEFTGDPGLVRLDPRWYQAALQFVNLGFHHILDGTDHLLFLACLVIPFRRFRALIPIVTSFTVAHSITLIASAYDLAPGALWFPPLVETLIATSIVYMALENIVGKTTVHRRGLITFGFGLVHGFGFSFALRETLQFAGNHLLASLLSFNVGVELGQLLVLVLLIPCLELLFRFAVAERMGTIILSAFVAHTAWHWLEERAAKLSQFHFELPELTPALLASILSWLMVAVFLAGIAWLIRLASQRRTAPAVESTEPEQSV